MTCRSDCALLVCRSRCMPHIHLIRIAAHTELMLLLMYKPPQNIDCSATMEQHPTYMPVMCASKITAEDCAKHLYHIVDPANKPAPLVERVDAAKLTSKPAAFQYLGPLVKIDAPPHRDTIGAFVVVSAQVAGLCTLTNMTTREKAKVYKHAITSHSHEEGVGMYVLQQQHTFSDPSASTAPRPSSRTHTIPGPRHAPTSVHHSGRVSGGG